MVLHSLCKDHIDVLVRIGMGDYPWFLTGFYSNPETELRDSSWQLLRRLGENRHLLWVCGGDFKEILFASEKKGIMKDRLRQYIDKFCEAVARVQLKNIGYSSN